MPRTLPIKHLLKKEVYPKVGKDGRRRRILRQVGSGMWEPERRGVLRGVARRLDEGEIAVGTAYELFLDKGSHSRKRKQGGTRK
ncbi:hypothetical protein KKE06_01240 [Candidatus Micrarchaeota archaeon]|nr:hypothetical protein [Candidatus Micrarchaeota archaeon]